MRKEVHTGVVTPPPLPPVLDDDLAPGERTPDLIEAVENPIKGDYFAQLAFMEEPVTIRIEPLAEKNAARFVSTWVNGVMQLIEVGKPQEVKRKYVETLARAMPVDIQTQTGTPEDAHVFNNIIRVRRCQYPFSVMHDPNPRGAAWLTNLLQSQA